MNITAVRVSVKRKPENKTLANAALTIDGELVITGLQVVSGAKGVFVSMPQYRDSNGEYHDRVYVLTKKTKELISDLILTEYEKQKNNVATHDGSDSDY
ncbi:MAG: SpoVG family protein [Oscillospiraceae bacterium]|nr:SpoVG family protein [Oscillospiraceae bacterium]